MSVRRQISWDGRLTHSTTAAGGNDNDDKEYYNEERERDAVAEEVRRAVLAELR